MYKRTTLAVAALIVFGLGIILAGLRDIADTAPAATITITQAGFSPALVKIRMGESVQFVNGEPSTCDSFDNLCFFWPASDGHPTHEFYPEFDPREPLAPGESWTFSFERAGTWGFHDHFNANKRGSVTVER